MNDIARDLNCDKWQEVMYEEDFSEVQENQVWQILKKLTLKEHNDNEGLHWGVYNILSGEEAIEKRIENLNFEITEFKNGAGNFEVEELDDLLGDLLEEEEVGLGGCIHCDDKAVIDAGEHGNLCEDCYDQHITE
ncbi:hypothetical protein PM10SUCC1_19360 [Propionigenium maris DSM 9537]|uniref:Uncharacterized protein n=1 Tax=Propionigenium maris DSM 9537 TaxID=1123000 RepID=A0A9W6GLH0_9FUSO|nr:hypothetical protein [Propionigenium maris]GLI56422.1 hypothetical protein PM10SUCC1_19360 [Propionigenium maris DSM 9537]